MKRLHFSIDINASRETIWSAIISHERYKYWTKFFSEGSDFVGGWQKGDAIQFVTVDEDGAQMGMSSEIAESIHLQHISIHHLGMIKDGVEDRTSPEAMKWTPAYENYYLEETADGRINFRVETDMEDEYIEYMSQIWPTALDALRSICEDNLLPFTPITIETVIPAASEKVWDSWTSPEAVTQWNFASPDWYCPKAVNHLAVGEKNHC